MFKLLPAVTKGSKAMRDVYCETMMSLAAKNENIVALDADLVSSSGMKKFFEAYPDRAFQCGVAEANMIGTAAGLSLVGKIPYAHTFGPFASRRVCDQIFLSACYAKLNVRIIGSDPGITAAYNGGTHMPFEDMGVLRSIAKITLIEPSDPVMVRDIITQLADKYGVYYIRMGRKGSTYIYEEGSSFEIGKGNVLKEGGDATVIASGIMVAEALSAAERLSKEGVSVRVVDMFTWKPMDTELVEKCASETGAIVTAENHNIYGGLGAAVAEACVKTKPVPIEMVGVMDEFGQVGTEDYLRTAYNLTDDAIIEAVRKVLKRK